MLWAGPNTSTYVQEDISSVRFQAWRPISLHPSDCFPLSCSPILSVTKFSGNCISIVSLPSVPLFSSLQCHCHLKTQRLSEVEMISGPSVENKCNLSQQLPISVRLTWCQAWAQYERLLQVINDVYQGSRKQGGTHPVLMYLILVQTHWFVIYRWGFRDPGNEVNASMVSRVVKGKVWITQLLLLVLFPRHLIFYSGKVDLKQGEEFSGALERALWCQHSPHSATT